MTCPPVQLSNGEAYANKLLVNGRYPYNTMVSFSCNVGYNLDTTESGSNSSTICLDTGTWSHTTPHETCIVRKFNIFNKYPV